MSGRALVAALLFLAQAVASVAGSSTAATTAPSVPALHIGEDEAPEIDGVLTEAVWETAQVASDFRQRDPVEGAEATEETEVRILYSAKSIYFGVTCWDSHPGGILASELKRDNDLETDDRFSILLDTFHDRRNAFLFRTNALGTRYDAQITDEKRQFNRQWDEKWQAVAKIDDRGWTVEIEIPLKSLRASAEKVQTWGMNFERIIRRKNEETYWAGYSRDYEFWNVSQAGELTDLREVRTGLRLRVKPYGLGGFSQLPNEFGEGTHFDNESKFGLEVVKASITPSTMADFTVNPDFAQAEVDEARFNLTRFSLFFPERREFFLERAGVFDFGTRRERFGRAPDVLAFFSRRVGLYDGTPIPINYGARVTGDEGGFQFGFMNVQTRTETLDDSDDFDEFPGDMSTVFRIKRNVLERSYVGAIFTDRNFSSLDRYNRLAGLDGSFVLFDKLTLSGYWAQTSEDGETDDSQSYQFAAAWVSDLLDFTAERTRVDEDFNPELGFVRRDDIVKSRLRGVWKPRPSNISFIRQFRFSTDNVWFKSRRNFLESRENDIFIGANFESGDFFGGSYNSKYEFLEEEFEIQDDVIIPPGSYDFSDFVLFGRTYTGRRVSGDVRVTVGNFFNGDIVSASAGPTILFNENLSVELDYSFNRARFPDGNCPNLVPGDSCGFTVNVVNTIVNYNFTNKLLTSTSVQYNSAAEGFLINWRLNYIYRPGDDFFIVYNEGRDFDEPFNSLVNRTLLVKFTHSFDF